MPEDHEIAASLRRRARCLRWHAGLMFLLVIALLACGVSVFFIAGDIAQRDLARDSGRITSQQVERQLAEILERATTRRDRIKELVTISLPENLVAAMDREKAARESFEELMYKIAEKIRTRILELKAYSSGGVSSAWELSLLDTLYASDYKVATNITKYNAIQDSNILFLLHDIEMPNNKVKYLVQGIKIFTCNNAPWNLSLSYALGSLYPDNDVITPAEVELFLREHRQEIIAHSEAYETELSNTSQLVLASCEKQSKKIEENEKDIRRILAEQKADADLYEELTAAVDLLRTKEFHERFGIDRSVDVNNTHVRDNNLILIIQTNITRFGPLVIILFFVHIVFAMYKYSTRLAGHYDARADALELIDKISDPARLDTLTNTLSPSAYDFGAGPKAPTDVVVEGLAQLASRKST